VLKLVAIALALVALALLVLRAGPEELRPAFSVGGLALGGFILALIFIAAGSDTLITRNIIVLLLPSAITLAGGLAVRSARGVGAAAATALCVIGVLAAIGVAADYPLQRPDWRAVAAVLGGRAAAGGSRVILIQHYRTLLPLSLYLHHLAFAGSGPLPGVREIDIVSIGAPERGKFCWWGSACNLVPSQMQRSYPIAGFREVWLRHSHQFSIMRLSSPTPATLTAAEVSRALRTTRLRRDELLIQR
jgi:hypothetical protein